MKDIMIDENTYNQVNDNTLDNYENFIESNPIVTDFSSWLKKNNKKDEEKIEIKKNKLEEQLKKDEDYRYFMYLYWLELYLPRFEMRYGQFNYSNSELSNKQKCVELLHYYETECGIKKVEEIFKRKPHRGILR